MSRSPSHKRAQNKAAGKKGRTEVKIKGGKIIDAINKSGTKITEVERGGTKLRLEKAVQRLKNRRSKQKILQVPQKDMKKAVEAMKKIKVKGTVTNMSKTKRRSIR